MAAGVRPGAEEMRRANEILAAHAPGVPEVPSPGRASLVLLLFESGKRGEDLDYRAYDTRWTELNEGSSAIPTDYFTIHADETSSTVFLLDWLKELLAKYDEKPGAPPEYTQPMSLKTLAELFGVHTNTMRRYLETRAVKAKRVGRNWAVQVDDMPTK